MSVRTETVTIFEFFKRPLLNKYNVDFYFSGHEHNLQYLRGQNKKFTKYFISGAGSKISEIIMTDKKIKQNGVVNAISQPGYIGVSLDLSENKQILSKLTAINVKGQQVFEYNGQKDNYIHNKKK